MSVSKVQRTGILVAQKIEKHLNATQRYAVRQRSTKLTPKSVGPLTTPDNLQLSKKLNWRNLMHFVELQIQQNSKQHYKCRLARMINKRWAAFVMLLTTPDNLQLPKKYLTDESLCNVLNYKFNPDCNRDSKRHYKCRLVRGSMKDWGNFLPKFRAYRATLANIYYDRWNNNVTLFPKLTWLSNF